MIPWATVIPALKAWFTAATGISLVLLKNEPRPFVQATWGQLEILEVQSYDMDDTSIVEVVLPGGSVVTRQAVRGQRTFRLELRVLTNRQDPPGIADNKLELLKTRVQLDTVSALLVPVNVALGAISPSTVADVLVDDRVYSGWLATAEMNAAFEYIDTDPSPGADAPFITQVEGTYSIPADALAKAWTSAYSFLLTTTNAVAVDLFPLVVLPLSGVWRYTLLITADNTITGARARWVLRVVGSYNFDGSGTALVETILHDATPGTPATLYDVQISYEPTRLLRVEVVGDPTHPVKWVCLIAEDKLS
jgi:hypothetical protein